MLKTLLFDLDGTLLPFDQNRFMHGYFHALVPEIAHLVNTKEIAAQILTATQAMVENEDPQLPNIDAFKHAFFGTVDVAESDIWPIFDEFYHTKFGDLQSLTEPSPISREICRSALSKGYELVLATNPIFPDDAVRHRMAWAGIDDVPFKLVTTMEHMHFCKPSPKYYLEILDRIGRSPEECMMIGNDVQEDGVAGKLGMQTFLVKDFVIDRGVGHIEFTHEGSLKDVLSFIESLAVLEQNPTFPS
ncbi:HAD family hydrolase [Alicyclobacillus ferrooxydans]|uniref:Hydrolase n=1 Tax=Alicyclobacillus ferrooxydans TaxID=471514 RepID=A0A0P9CRL5_9BACL|nr:HAD family hydrolase [Alicyclobacillus ferrooxydans]KPV45476.1 hydrolase [Alicyclobacillus ferrooxydans]